MIPSFPSLLADLRVSVLGFLKDLSCTEQPGRYLPCPQGLTEQGRAVSLGFSCLALKTLWTLSAWDELPLEVRKSWISHIGSFRTPDQSDSHSLRRGAFVDPALIGPQNGKCRSPWLAKLLGEPEPSYTDWIVLAETKQAFATLEQIGERPMAPYLGLPNTAKRLLTLVNGLDWARPWEAGGRASCIATLATCPHVWNCQPVERAIAKQAFKGLFDSLADKETGGYFQGTAPPYGELINGTMKVMTAMNWTGQVVHYPERLIDSCLSCLPSSEGCHVVDVVYILHVLTRQTGYRQADIMQYCQALLPMILAHRQEGGGFSYYPDRAQNHYYSAVITTGPRAGDLHGTLLLVWALAMLGEIFEAGTESWRVIRP